ncbi:MAG: hypothetical protein JWM74_2528 [Myxococcaceae bacterium]|nr:hypothetical protein [Myxococcaceae bacterium]
MSLQAASDREPEVEPFCYVEGTTPLEVAEACRAAGLAFVNGVASGWTKTDLARWLVGPYREAACPLPGAERGVSEPPAPGVRVEARISRLLHEVRAHVVRGLESSPDGLVDLPCWALTAGSILRSQHDDGEAGFIPVDWPRMRLEDRVMSLFAVDCLMRGADYATKLVVCRRCKRVSFDEKAHAVGLCDLHYRPVPRSSGVRLKTVSGEDHDERDAREAEPHGLLAI